MGWPQFLQIFGEIFGRQRNGGGGGGGCAKGHTVVVEGVALLWSGKLFLRGWLNKFLPKIFSHLMTKNSLPSLPPKYFAMPGSQCFVTLPFHKFCHPPPQQYVLCLVSTFMRGLSALKNPSKIHQNRLKHLCAASLKLLR